MGEKNDTFIAKQSFNVFFDLTAGSTYAVFTPQM